MAVIEVLLVLLLILAAFVFLYGLTLVAAFVYGLAKTVAQAPFPDWSKGTWAVRTGLALVWLGAVGVLIAQVRLPWLNVYQWERFGDFEVPMPFYDVFYSDLPSGRSLPAFVRDYAEIWAVASGVLFLTFSHEPWEGLSKRAWAIGFALAFAAPVFLFSGNRMAMLRAQRAIDPAYAYEIGDGALVYTFAIAALMLGLILIGVAGVVQHGHRRSATEPRATDSDVVEASPPVSDDARRELTRPGGGGLGPHS